MKIEIYGKEMCPNCETAKNIAEKNELPVNYYKMGSDFEIPDMMSRIGKRVAAFPQIFIDNEYVGSLKEFKDFLEKMPEKLDNDDLSDFEL